MTTSDTQTTSASYDDGLLSSTGIMAFGLYSVFLVLAIVAGLICIWPEDKSDWLSPVLSSDKRFFLVVALSGSLGSFVHMATSFADFVGNRALRRSWLWWYILRPFIGLSWSLLVYFVLRGVMFSGAASLSNVNPFGIASVAGLIGMFSKQATDKVREIFDAFFRTERTAVRADTSKPFYGTGPGGMSRSTGSGASPSA
jgi:hypothetical protein